MKNEGDVTSNLVNKEDPQYCGYQRNGKYSENAGLTHVGPGTQCGEYMRRFWHPVALVSELGDSPKLVRILGEDLVLFRDGRNNVGLLHRHCIHRGASLEYGVCELDGIRCCYHGWLYSIDGTILDIPGEPPGERSVERLRRTRKIGSYPTIETKGIIFAYLGPPRLKPAFPVYDTFDIPGNETVPYRREYPCNWLQITENAMDPVHAVFLHVRSTGAQFDKNWGQIGVRDFHKRDFGFYYTNSRRVNDNIWVRIHEVILPNLTHAGAVMSMDGCRRKYFGRNSFTRWVVPVDDVNSRVIAWANFGELTDPPHESYCSKRGIDVLESGVRMDRSYEEAKRYPGDYEAFISQGPIASHELENLTPSDRGVGMFRARLRKAVRELHNGMEPPQPTDGFLDAPIPTYCGDTVLAMRQGKVIDETHMLEVSREVMSIIQAADRLKGLERYEFITKKLKQYEETL